MYFVELLFKLEIIVFLLTNMIQQSSTVLMFNLIAIGDPLGGCCVSPHGYAVMLNKVSSM